MKFNNKQNEPIQRSNGDTIWHSRSCAVVTTVCCYIQGEPHILLAKRGEGCPDEVGKWNLPCGYLDWNETLTEGAEREVYEETGVSLRKIIGNEENIISNHMHEPWKVNSQISKRTSSKQNISHHFYLIYTSKEIPKTSTDYCEPNEIEAIQWVTLSALKSLDFAFEHDVVIHEFLEKNNIVSGYQSKHTHKIKHYRGDLSSLAEEVGDLYYDSLADFLLLLSDKLDKDAKADSARQRYKLSSHLKDVSINMKKSAIDIQKAWGICEPHVLDSSGKDKG